MRPTTAALPRRCPDREWNASAIHGRRSARAALLQSPILSTAPANPGTRIAGHVSRHQQLRVTNLNQDLTPGSSDSNKSLNVITAAAPHELIRAEGPIYTSVGQRPRSVGQISDSKG